MEGEPIQIWNCSGVRRMQRWHHMPADPHLQRWVTVGAYDGGWFVEYVGPPLNGGWAYPDEASARRDAERLMAEVGPWVEVPAAYDSRGRPL